MGKKEKVNYTGLLRGIEGIVTDDKSEREVLIYKIIEKSSNKKLIIPSWQLASNVTQFKKRYPYFCKKLVEFGSEKFTAEVMERIPAKRNDGTMNREEVKGAIKRIVLDEIAFFNLNPNYTMRGDNKTGYSFKFINAINYHKIDRKESLKDISEKAG